MTISIKIRARKPSLVPVYCSSLAAGADLRADLAQPTILHPNCSLLIPTGLYLELPEGVEAQIRPKSGHALKHQITVLNTPGTIDADYRGEVGVILINHGKEPFVIEPEMRIAQLVIAKAYQATFVRAEELTTTTRGEGGFGHTGSH